MHKTNDYDTSGAGNPSLRQLERLRAFAQAALHDAEDGAGAAVLALAIQWGYTGSTDSREVYAYAARMALGRGAMDNRYIYDPGYHILIDGVPTPTDMETWAEWVKDFDKYRVAWTEVGEYVVSTVFLWFDHSWGYGEVPLWFETMIFRQHEHTPDRFSDFQERYTTIEEAMHGHERAVAMVRNADAATGAGEGQE